jgi:hypothetical protein
VDRSLARSTALSLGASYHATTGTRVTGKLGFCSHAASRGRPNEEFGQFSATRRGDITDNKDISPSSGNLRGLRRPAILRTMPYDGILPNSDGGVMGSKHSRPSPQYRYEHYDPER